MKFTSSFIVLLLIALAAVDAFGAPCTDGIDCYCDLVRIVGDEAHDPNLLVCEDFEAVTLHADTGPGDHSNAGGENVEGPWYDNGPGARGFNSYWTRTYGAVTGGCAWRSGEPSSPILGEQCTASTCFAKEWHPTDLWQGNSGACIDIIRNGEFNAEVSDLLPPVVPGSHSGVFDGLQTFGRRVGPGRLAGLGSSASFGGAFTTIGVTMALAYPTNSARADLWDYPWKHNEWVTEAEGRGDGPFTFHNGSALSENDPFQHFMFLHRDSDTQANCNAAIAGATIRRGTVSCSNVAMSYRADPAHYQRSTDFPFGTWGCIQGYFKNLGSVDVEIKIWFNETLIIDIDNLNGAVFSNREGYDALFWNSYSNRNQTANLSTETTYRYEDNIHITAGPPVSCEVLGFPSGTAGDSIAPAAPRDVRIAE